MHAAAQQARQGLHLVAAVCNATSLKLLQQREGYLPAQILWQSMLTPLLCTHRVSVHAPPLLVCWVPFSSLAACMGPACSPLRLVV